MARGIGPPYSDPVGTSEKSFRTPSQNDYFRGFETGLKSVIQMNQKFTIHSRTPFSRLKSVKLITTAACSYH